MPVHVIYLLCGLAVLALGITGMAWALCVAASRADALQREADANRRRYLQQGR